MKAQIAALALCAILSAASRSSAQEWTAPVRGSWVRQGAAQDGDVVLAGGNHVCDLVVPESEGSIVRQAATFLAGDLEKLTGQRPAIVSRPTQGHASIHFVTMAAAGNDKWPYPWKPGDWEAYTVRTTDAADAYLVGSDARGTAYAAYTLSERLGIDPLYLWTGYVPAQSPTLVLKQTDFSSGPPTIKYRGFFHDDEDILPRPFENSGYPYRYGDVPTEWYAKYFETALRLRMNMVAPYTRVHRRYAVQKMASDWGLFYTSHHYDILLSNPFGFTRYALGEKRHAGTVWDWYTNREGMLNFWRGGVEENKDLDCIYPVGLRGTDDAAYKFPSGTSPAEQAKVFQEVIDDQIKMTRQIVTPPRRPVFHFTLYNEMLDKYLAGGAFAMPQDVILVWPDDNDGRLRALPKDLGKWKHGVYYHLAYLGPVTKQNADIVPPARVADEMKKMVDAGVTEYLLTNVSEMREFVMEGRMLAEIAWDAKTALRDMPHLAAPEKPLPAVPSAKHPPPPDPPAPAAERFVNWWCREYFATATDNADNADNATPDAAADAAADAAEFYHRYDAILNRYDKAWYGSDKVQSAIASLMKKVAGEPFAAAEPQTLPDLLAREKQYEDAFAIADRATAKMTRPQRQFFYDQAELPLRIDWRGVQAAIELVKAMDETTLDAMWSHCDRAMSCLETMETEIARAEHPPFEQWYRKTWIRRENSPYNVHRPYEQLRAFMSSGGRAKLTEPPGAARPVFPIRRD